MKDILLIDLKAILQEKLARLSQEEALIVVYIHHRHAILGALTQLLQINLADILLGKASTENADVLLLTFDDYAQANELFRKIPQDWHLEGEEEVIHVQLWHQGRLETENLCVHGPSDLVNTSWSKGGTTSSLVKIAV